LKNNYNYYNIYNINTIENNNNYSNSNIFHNTKNHKIIKNGTNISNKKNIAFGVNSNSMKINKSAINSSDKSIFYINANSGNLNTNRAKATIINDTKSTIILGDLNLNMNLKIHPNKYLLKHENTFESNDNYYENSLDVEPINMNNSKKMPYEKNNPNSRINFDSDNINNNSETVKQIKSIDKIYRNPSLFSKKIYFRKVLVIDDEFLIRSTVKRYFTKINISQQIIDYTIFEASNVFEAINIIYSMYLEKKYIDFIIIDEQMPYIKGSHMISMFKLIASENNFCDIKFVSYSAFNTKEIKEIIKEKGADYIINKPASFNEFYDIINDLEEKHFKDN